uniref:Uncharacterized protein n=1 Tax=Picea glauca TaxID=3330 RepID=A0A124GMZ4_PICGL|nr:hypothetical protein ABT39_MTgene6187 [Picea glauca]QHR88708.1 hypothetical protein Q903MT_gene2722 [Picea sitchensis]
MVGPRSIGAGGFSTCLLLLLRRTILSYIQLFLLIMLMTKPPN